MSLLSLEYLQDEGSAYKWVEAHVWPDGPVCPHCGSIERLAKMQGKKTRFGLYKCYACRKQFRVTVGTIFEKSHIPLHIWLQAMFLIAGSKKGISSNQLHRTLGVTLKTAWFMSHRIREAMRTGGLGPLGVSGQVVEADETYLGTASDQTPSEQRRGRPLIKRKPGTVNKRTILGLIERGGNVRTFHVVQANKDNVAAVVTENVARESMLYTDESRLYTQVGKTFAAHETVKHSAGEYVRGPVHSNTIESYFSIFKRGMRGTYQHCAEKHLHRYLAEFDFRHNNRVALGVNDVARAGRILGGITGKRLTYRTTLER